MSRHGEITIPWGDGEYKFRLGYGELRQLEEACDAGAAYIHWRLQTKDPPLWRMNDYRETLRQGLLGGGMSQPEALSKIAKFVDQRPPYESLIPAQLVLKAHLAGPIDDLVGKLFGGGQAKTKARRSREARPPSPDLSAPPP